MISSIFMYISQVLEGGEVGGEVPSQKQRGGSWSEELRDGLGRVGLGAGSLKYVKREYIIVKRSHWRGRESTSAHQCKRDVRVRKLPVGTTVTV